MFEPVRRIGAFNCFDNTVAVIESGNRSFLTTITVSALGYSDLEIFIAVSTLSSPGILGSGVGVGVSPPPPPPPPEPLLVLL